MAFWGFLAIVILIYSENKILALAAGIALGCSIFFGKLIGVVFIVPFAMYFLYEIYFQNKSSSKVKGIYFLSGLLLLTALWGFFVYLPMQSHVDSYISEQVYNNHGMPQAFLSVSNFINMYLAFGHKSHLIARMFIVCLLASFYFIAIGYNIFPFNKKNQEKLKIESVDIFIVTLIIAFYMFLMLWTYGPLRYQLVLIYPACASAAIFISYIWNRKKIFNTKNITYKLLHLIIPISILYCSYFVFEFNETIFAQSTFNMKQLFKFSGMALVALLYIFVINIWKNWHSKAKRKISKNFLILSIVLITGINIYRYYDWTVRPTYSVIDNSYDLTSLLSENALLSGSYASTLTIETKYNSIIHMFGVSNPDPNFFKRNPVTHLLIDRGNEQRARKDYPAIMKKAAILTTYYIGATSVNLYRVAGHTGNSIADSYQLSTYEKFALEFDSVSDSLFQELATEYFNAYPSNLSGNILIARHAMRNKNVQKFESSFLKAIEFSPTNYTQMALLARFYMDRYQKSHNLKDKNNALELYNKALRYFPQSVRLNKEKKELLNIK